MNHDICKSCQHFVPFRLNRIPYDDSHTCTIIWNDLFHQFFNHFGDLPTDEELSDDYDAASEEPPPDCPYILEHTVH